ncbi:choline uptake/conversion transcriptional regulator CudC [Halalkalibacillus halophilus]|uniref:choline uptake/conversion transcriptional regulator CudC n=1 Tax=Halalkalibacillus halophilus TaxID=392827 RepID=UPI000420C2FD|nr:GbsR/MarR family transcriptional regulator [Halalkalibacillus halophilus]
MNKDNQALERMEKAKDQVIGAISETMDLYGVTPSAGNLYATMYFEGEMTLDEMREILGMSKPSMSTSIRKLQEIEMVKKTYKRGSRKHTYMAEKDFFHSFMAFYCQMWDREVKMNLEAIKQSEKELKAIISDDAVSESIRKEAQEHYDMLENSKTYYHWLEDLVKSIRSEEIFEFLPKPPTK